MAKSPQVSRFLGQLLKQLICWATSIYIYNIQWCNMYVCVWFFSCFDHISHQFLEYFGRLNNERNEIHSSSRWEIPVQFPWLQFLNSLASAQHRMRPPPLSTMQNMFVTLNVSLGCILINIRWNCSLHSIVLNSVFCKWWMYFVYFCVLFSLL